MKSYIINCRLVSPGVDLPQASVEMEAGKIAAVHSGEYAPPAGASVFDAAGHMLMPGFIDIHTHGAGGGDFCSGRVEDLRVMAEAKLREGVTCFLPTTLTLDHDSIGGMMRAAADYRPGPGGPRVPGVHLEGPFINPACAGAQNPAFVRPPDLREIESWRTIGPIEIVSLAVEMAGGRDLVAKLSAMGITTSLAHTAATYAQFQDAKQAGLKHLTHFCNQMTPLHHREIGIVGAGLVDPDVSIELICDRIHLAPEMIALVFTLKPIEQLMLITDSTKPSHLADGDYELGGLPVRVVGGAARLANGALAGSTLRMNQALKNVHQITGRPLVELVRTTSWNQASSLGWHGFGKVEPGFHADLAVLSDDFDVVETFVSGVASGRKS